MRLVSVSILMSLMGCRSDEGIKKFNSTPEANITSHVTGDAETEGFSVAFLGFGSDANHAATELTATWYSGSDIICEESPLDTDGASSCERLLHIDDGDGSSSYLLY